MREQIISADRIFTGYEWLTGHAIVVHNETIQKVVPTSSLATHSVKFYKDCFIAPAFIDIQLYGASERLLAVYPEPQSLQLLYEYCRAGGAPLFLPTLATNSLEVFYKGIDAVRAYWSKEGKGVYGLHLEGPWISREKRGAHLSEFIHAPTTEEVQALLRYGKDVVKMITLAPEVCAPELVRMILDEGIIVSAGHSSATYEQAVQAFDMGISVATHLYNAMSPLQHRAPGMVGALFNHERARCSIIPDGYHVDFAAIKIAKKMMGNRLFVITDAVTETTEGGYRHHREGDKYVCNGTLSGSALTMHQAFVNLVRHASIEVEEAVRMCSLYPAQVLQQEERFGRIAPGCAAQLIVLDEQLALVDVFNG